MLIKGIIHGKLLGRRQNTTNLQELLSILTGPFSYQGRANNLEYRDHLSTCQGLL